MYFEWNNLSSLEFKNVTPEDVAAVVIASCEQHARHLPVGTDAFLGSSILQYSAEKAKRKIYVMSPVTYGYSAHHMDFPGSVTLSQSTLIHMLQDIARGALCTGFKKVVFMISHGGNSPSVQVALNELGSSNSDCEFVMFRYWDFMKSFMDGLRDTPLGGIGHAGEMETSLMMYLYPELVGDIKWNYKPASGNEWYHPDMFASNKVSRYRSFKDISPEGNVGVSKCATKQKGEQIINYVSEEIADFLDGYF